MELLDVTFSVTDGFFDKDSGYESWTQSLTQDGTNVVYVYESGGTRDESRGKIVACDQLRGIARILFDSGSTGFVYACSTRPTARR
jgi:hypothetical protein